MKKIYLNIILLLLLSCAKDESTVRKSFPLDAYHTVMLNNSFEVYLREGNDHRIELEGASSFVNKTQFGVSDSVLSISNNKKYKWNDPKNNIVKLWLTAAAFKLISANESCDISSINTISTPELGIILASKANTATIQVDNQTVYYWNNFPCGGKLTLLGRTRELKLWNTALMTVDASGLSAEYAIVDTDSKGNCNINVSKELKYSITGTGNINVYGNPASIIDEGSSNSGRLIIH